MDIILCSKCANDYAKSPLPLVEQVCSGSCAKCGVKINDFMTSAYRIMPAPVTELEPSRSRVFDSHGQPVCRVCNTATNRSYAKHRVLHCWNCGAEFPPLAVDEPQPDYSTVDLITESKYASLDIGKESRKRHFGFGYCLRCGRSNQEVADHFVRIDSHSSQGIACAECWAVCDLAERVSLAEAAFRSHCANYLGAAYSKHIHFERDHPEWLALWGAIHIEWEQKRREN